MSDDWVMVDSDKRIKGWVMLLAPQPAPLDEPFEKVRAPQPDPIPTADSGLASDMVDITTIALCVLQQFLK